MKKFSYEYIKFVIEVESNSGCKLLSNEYKNIREKLIIQCKCGNIFEKRFHDFKYGQVRCNECAHKILVSKLTYNYEYVKKVIEDNGYKLLDDKYIDAKTKLNLQCSIGHEIKIRFNDFHNGVRCSKCSKKYRKNTEDFKAEVFDLVGDEYQVCSNYVKAIQKIKLEHTLCGNIFYMTPSAFLNGQRCPICNESKGEKRIREWLLNNKIHFQGQFSFPDCMNIEPLRFDFAIFDNSEKTSIKCLIEYDGEFHYYPILGMKQLKYQQKNDNIKDNYCLNNNIILHRIAYWEFDNITKILEESLKGGCLNVHL